MSVNLISFARTSLYPRKGNQCSFCKLVLEHFVTVYGVSFRNLEVQIVKCSSIRQDLLFLDLDDGRVRRVEILRS